jgi:hypothetical protein
MSGRNVGNGVVPRNNGVFSSFLQVFAENGYDAINLSTNDMTLKEAGKHSHNKKFRVFIYLIIRSGDSSFDIVTGYGLDGLGSIPCGGNIGGSFSEGKAAGA